MKRSSILTTVLSSLSLFNVVYCALFTANCTGLSTLIMYISDIGERTFLGTDPGGMLLCHLKVILASDWLELLTVHN